MVVVGLLLANNGYAQQQFDGVCAEVKIEILQELALERVGFLATLEITNNVGDDAITDFTAALTFTDPSQAESEQDASDLFFVQPPELTAINAVDGTGVIPPSQKAKIEWFIIPKITAGGTEAIGKRYWVGASLAGKLYGEEIPSEILDVYPDSITVKPEPQLQITYFQPRDVQGDDPFTPEVEAPIPFTIGVLVKNAGHGIARNVRIDSQQPKIVENENGLILVAQLLGSRVNDAALDQSSLNLDLGTIDPGATRKGAWDMITSLSGEFVEFKASYRHASELGGEATSIITAMNAYFIEHEVLSDRPGTDQMLDFLTDTDDDRVPDALYESDGNVVPVNQLTDVAAEMNPDRASATLEINADREDWIFVQVGDPGQAKFPIEKVVRSDGKTLNPNNVWTSIRYERSSNKKQTFLNIFDFVALGSYSYEISYQAVQDDIQAPVSTLRFAGEVTEQNGTYHVLPDTQLYFTSGDQSPVSIFYNINGGPDQPAVPFTLNTPGQYLIGYHAEDAVGNVETEKTADVVVAGAHPAVASFYLQQDKIINVGEAISVRPTKLEIEFQGTGAPTGLDAQLNVYRGVTAWPTVRGVPTSPAVAGSATLHVGGRHVDFYRYQLNAESWSAEYPVSEPIILTGLDGPVTLRINGRNSHGNYLADADILEVSWTVSASAPDITVTGVPATPTNAETATLAVAGTGVELYRFRLDNSYFHAETEPTQPIELTGLSQGEHTIDVIARIDGVWQDEADAATVHWKIDRGYGFNFTNLARIRQMSFPDVGSELHSVAWDGLQDDGAVPVPGWYTVEVKLGDALGRSVSAKELVEIGDLMPSRQLLAGAADSLQANPHATGNWLVWQEYNNGTAQIKASDLRSGTAIFSITDSSYHQQRPRTDGTYAVWESRQQDGTWDIAAVDLQKSDPPFKITDTIDTDERNAVIDWPWVVFQARPVGQPDAPWQLRSWNMVQQVFADVDPTGQDQIDPAVHGSKLVWQDWRDPGNGEIYFKDLIDGTVRRITDSAAGQYSPALYGNWIVWSDTRNGQNELYGYNLLQRREKWLTSSLENETRPFLYRDWLVYEEDSIGVPNTNIRVLNLSTMANAQLTNTASEKAMPSLAGGFLVWLDNEIGYDQVLTAPMPRLQAIFDNNNAVPITESLLTHRQNAKNLLSLWQSQGGVQAITRFTQWPNPFAETLHYDGGLYSGADFALTADDFVWVKFNSRRILDLGYNDETAIDLLTGVNVVSYTNFPAGLTAYGLIDGLGSENVGSVRMLNSETGKWQAAAVVNGVKIGEDFQVQQVAVVWLDMKQNVTQWVP